jgi:hypothetical protein
MVARLEDGANGAGSGNTTAAVAVYAMFGVMFFSDRQAGFSEMARV